MQRITRRYRCEFAPATPEGLAHPLDAGILPFVEVEAHNAEAAQRLAHLKTGKPIVGAMRIEALPAPRTKRTPKSLANAPKAARIAAGAAILSSFAR